MNSQWWWKWVYINVQRRNASTKWEEMIGWMKIDIAELLFLRCVRESRRIFRGFDPYTEDNGLKQLRIQSKRVLTNYMYNDWKVRYIFWMTNYSKLPHSGNLDATAENKEEMLKDLDVLIVRWEAITALGRQVEYVIMWWFPCITTDGLWLWCARFDQQNAGLLPECGIQQNNLSIQDRQTAGNDI